MSDIKEQIKTKIKERIAFAEKCADAACEKNLHSALEANEMLIRQYKLLLADIDSLSEEKSSEDLNLDKEYNDFVKSDPIYIKLVNNIVGKAIARHFAEWGARHSINWGDVQLLDTFILELSREEKDGANWGDSEKFYTEVLRRFHEFNNKKIPEIVAEWEAKHLK